jgi:gluconokinase
MGVSGCGKSSVGESLASRLALPFIEGDGLHPESNVAKIAA